MFVYSLRATTLKFFAVVCVTLTALITMIAFIPEYAPENAGYVGAIKQGEITYDKIKTEADRADFLRQFGWEVTGEPLQVAEVLIPRDFDKVLLDYNEIQRRQGLDMSKYKGKTATRYTYEIKNYEGEQGRVFANIIVYRSRVIAGDICSEDVNGFVYGFEGQ